jgi:lipopolysaccharide export system permease protein
MGLVLQKVWGKIRKDVVVISAIYFRQGLDFGPKTLFSYMAKNFLLNLLFMSGILLGIVYLLDTVELLRRLADKPALPFALVLQMSLLKLPETAQIISPFIVLFTALFTFWQLSKRSELIVLRASGVSVWQFLAPLLLVAFACGLCMTVLINPIGAFFIGKYQNFEAQYISDTDNRVAIFDDGLWLKQNATLSLKPQGTSSQAADQKYQIVLYAEKIVLPDWRLQRVMALFFDRTTQNLAARVDAPVAQLKDGQFLFRQATRNDFVGGFSQSQTLDVFQLPTELTPQKIEDSFSTPESMGFWALPRFIRTLDSTGFDSTKLRIHFQNLLAQPFLFLAMVILAACVSLRPQRQGGVLLYIISGILIGFFIFFFSNFLQALGSSHQIPVFLSAWSATLVSLLFGTALLLNSEDG